MTRFLSRMTALALGGFGVSSVWAADVSFSGFFDGDVAGYYNSDTTNSNFVYQANHELDLTASVKLNPKVSVDLYATSYTTGTTGGTVPAQGAPAENRWTGFSYDGFLVTFAASEMLTTKFGDLSYSSGQFNYYGYKRTNTYAVNLKDRGFRGIEVDVAGLTVAGGADAASVAGAYAAYNVEIGESNIKPFVSVANDNVADSLSLRGGLDASLVFGANKLKLAAGVLKDKGDEASFTFAVEPILSFGSVSLAATAFYAVLDDEDPTAIAVPEYMFFYVEPGYAFNPTFSVGLPLEYHTMSWSSDASVEEFWVVPTFYANLADGLTWSVWAQNSLRLGDDFENSDPYFGIGSEAILSF